MADPIVTAHRGRASLNNSAWYGNQLVTFLAIGDDTGGRSALLRMKGNQETELPPHSHAAEDVTIYLLAGEITVCAGGSEMQVCPGEMVTIPRGLEHTIKHGTFEATTYLLQFSPAGFEQYFFEMSEPAEYLGLPENPSPPDRARMMATAARYGCTFRGDLP